MEGSNLEDGPDSPSRLFPALSSRRYPILPTWLLPPRLLEACGWGWTAGPTQQHKLKRSFGADDTPVGVTEAGQSFGTSLHIRVPNGAKPLSLTSATRIHFSRSRALWGGRSGRMVTSPGPSPVEVAPRTELTTAPATLLNCVTVALTDGQRWECPGRSL